MKDLGEVISALQAPAGCSATSFEPDSRVSGRCITVVHASLLGGGLQNVTYPADAFRGLYVSDGLVSDLGMSGKDELQRRPSLTDFSCWALKAPRPRSRLILQQGAHGREAADWPATKLQSQP